ncbi:MAG: radical SAM protein [Fibrobacter sp.]|nr:radical SAM protein [Fibrobacter sp.]
MKITFVYPKFDKFLETYPELAEMPAIAATWAYRMPPAMGIPILINILPPDIQWRIIDQNIEPVDYDDDADLIAISFFTPQAGYAYEIGDNFRKRGKTVVMGGMHPSMAPEFTAPHCDALCIGEGDKVWPSIIEDFRNKTLKSIYRAEPVPQPEEIVSPKPGIFDVENKYDWHASLVSITRGCPFGCDWCNVPIYQGDKIRLRPLEKVVEEIKKLSGKEFYITDDMIMLNRPRITRYMMELCEKIRDFKVNMFLSCSPAMNTDPEFLDAIASAGAKSMYTVFASDPFSARFFARHPGIWQRTIDLVKQLEDRGIRFFGSFGVGFDTCMEDQFDLILEFCEKANVKTAEFFIATPFPNTPFWHKIEAENRFIERDWKKFNCANVVFKPKHTSEKQLRDGFVRLWREFFSKVNHEESLSSFHQKLENILKSREFSQNVKDAVARGMKRAAANNP